jgi:hypothetical protein
VPKKVLPNEDDIARIAKELQKRGFVPVQGLDEYYRSTKDERMIPPTPREGAELGFLFQKNDLKLFVWTSWLLAAKKARERDSGWIIIEQEGERRYALQLRRTKHFARRLIMEARIGRARLRHRPYCLGCEKPMYITYGKGRGSRYWRCPLRHMRMSWDMKEFLRDLSEEARKHLLKRRKSRRRDYKRCRAAGKPIRQAAFRRRLWKRMKLPIKNF